MSATIETPKVLSPEEIVRNQLAEMKAKGLPAPPVIVGAFGDMTECDGIVEQVIQPPEGGLFVKIFGCSHLWKGFPEKHIVEGLGMGKAMISLIPRKIFGRSWLFLGGMALLYIFRRKRFYHYLNEYFNAIHLNLTTKSTLPETRYNTFTRELRRTGEHAIYEMLMRNGEEPDLGITRSKHYKIWELAYHILLFVCLFLEYDNAYRLRVQDVLVLLDKAALKENSTKELRRLYGIMIQREHPKYGIRKKWQELERPVFLMLRLSKVAREFAKVFFNELDLEKVKMDDADRYFSLRRRTFAFWDAPVEERLKEKERIDKERGHIRVQPIYGKAPTGELIINAIKVGE